MNKNQSVVSWSLFIHTSFKTSKSYIWVHIILFGHLDDILHDDFLIKVLKNSRSEVLIGLVYDTALLEVSLQRFKSLDPSILDLALLEALKLCPLPILEFVDEV